MQRQEHAQKWQAQQQHLQLQQQRLQLQAQATRLLLSLLCALPGLVGIELLAQPLLLPGQPRLLLGFLGLAPTWRQGAAVMLERPGTLEFQPAAACPCGETARLGSPLLLFGPQTSLLLHLPSQRLLPPDRKGRKRCRSTRKRCRHSVIHGQARHLMADNLDARPSHFRLCLASQLSHQLQRQQPTWNSACSPFRRSASLAVWNGRSERRRMVGCSAPAAITPTAMPVDSSSFRTSLAGLA